MGIFDLNENKNFLISHWTNFASLIGKASHALPDLLHRLFEDVAKGLRVAGTGIDVPGRA